MLVRHNGRIAVSEVTKAERGRSEEITLTRRRKDGKFACWRSGTKLYLNINIVITIISMLINQLTKKMSSKNSKFGADEFCLDHFFTSLGFCWNSIFHFPRNRKMKFQQKLEDAKKCWKQNSRAPKNRILHQICTFPMKFSIYSENQHTEY